MAVINDIFNLLVDAKFKSRVQQYENDLQRLVNKNMHIKDETKKRQVGDAIRKIYTNGLLQDDLGKALRVRSNVFLNWKTLTPGFNLDPLIFFLIIND